jgi:hypothetical protein
MNINLSNKIWFFAYQETKINNKRTFLTVASLSMLRESNKKQLFVLVMEKNPEHFEDFGNLF